MKPNPISPIIVAVVLASFSTAPAAEPEKSDKPVKKVAWQVTGELEEACSCAPACPCWFKSLPTKMTCDGVQIVFITKGKYGKLNLDGLAVAQYVQSPEGKTMFESFGNWKFDNIYIDEKANEQQREALKVLAAHFFPPAAQERKLSFVPITRKIEGDEHTTTIGSVGVCSGHLVEGGDGKPPRVINPPLADPTHREFLQGETTLLTYSDAGQGWKYEKSNYMRNKFKVDDAIYAKHEAAMAKKMAEMKEADKAKPADGETKPKEK
jgi:hypothetical protein